MARSYLIFSSCFPLEDASKAKYVCEICGKSYVRSWSYYGHLREHADGSKEHKCELCGKVFQFASLLKQHQLTHTGKLLLFAVAIVLCTCIVSMILKCFYVILLLHCYMSLDEGVIVFLHNIRITQ